MPANAEIRGTASRQLVCQKIELAEQGADLSHPRADRCRGRLQAVGNAAAQLVPTTPPQGTNQRRDARLVVRLTARMLHVVHPVHAGGRQSFRRFNDHKMKRNDSACRCHALAPAATDGRTAVQEERHVRAQLRSQFGQPLAGPAELPCQVAQLERRRGVARTTAQAGLDGDPFDQFNLGTAAVAASRLKQLQRAHHQIISPRRW